MKTKRILVNSAKPGMIVADDVYSSDNHLIIPIDTKLTTEVIAKLKGYSIFAIKIYLSEEGVPATSASVAPKPKKPAPKPVQPAPESLTYFERIHASEEFTTFQEGFVSSVDSLKDSLNQVLTKSSDVDVDDMISDVSYILSQCRNPLHMLDMLYCMRGFDDLTYVHSMNVALISNVIGTWMHLPADELKLLTLAGLLHDVGKLKIPKEIIAKPSGLTDEEFQIIRSHPKYGFDILKGKNLDKRVARVALQHHERIDGSGYPMGLESDDLDKFSKIIAIADVYDAMTANRVYREGICPFTVIETFEKDRHLYDPGVLYLFLERTVEAYINTEVLLSNGVRGKIVLLNRDIPSKPTVIGEDGTTYNLAMIPGLTIKMIL